MSLIPFSVRILSAFGYEKSSMAKGGVSAEVAAGVPGAAEEMLEVRAGREIAAAAKTAPTAIFRMSEVTEYPFLGEAFETGAEARVCAVKEDLGSNDSPLTCRFVNFGGFTQLALKWTKPQNGTGCSLVAWGFRGFGGVNSEFSTGRKMPHGVSGFQLLDAFLSICACRGE
ncbi:hypothetical protein ACWGEU_27800 [Streptomyces goshikiensis]